MADLSMTSDSPMTWERLQVCRVSVPNHIVGRRFASETVLLNVQRGVYYGMDETGTRFFEVLRESKDVRSAVTVLAMEFQAPLERLSEDLVHFCSELLDLGLIELEEPKVLGTR